jgi:hypothetical protein
VVLAAGDDDYAHINYGDSLVGIVLGQRFPKWERPAAIAACSELAMKLGLCTGNTAAPCPTAVAVTVGERPAPASLDARALRRARALLAQALISCSGGDAVALLLVAHAAGTAPPVANAV